MIMSLIRAPRIFDPYYIFDETMRQEAPIAREDTYEPMQLHPMMSLDEQMTIDHEVLPLRSTLSPPLPIATSTVASSLLATDRFTRCTTID